MSDQKTIAENQEPSLARALLERRNIVLGLGASAMVLGACQGGNVNVGGVEINTGQIANVAIGVYQGLSLSEEDELEIGRKMYGPMVDQSGGAYRNRRVQGAIDRFTAPFFEASDRKKMNWEITVVNDDTVNAWAMPGGKLAVNKGLLRYAANEHELASVIAHEVGHIEFAHTLKRMRTEKFVGAGGEVVKAAVASQGGNALGSSILTDQVMEVLGPVVSKMIVSGYSQSNELEADAYILDSFNKTGYDPMKAPDFFRTLMQLVPESNSKTNSLFSTHPRTQARIEALVEKGKEMKQPAKKPAPRSFRTLRRTFPLRQHYRRNTSTA